MFSKTRGYFLIRKQTFHHACISGKEIGGNIPCCLPALAQMMRLKCPNYSETAGES
jgi:hypothetical protein